MSSVKVGCNCKIEEPSSAAGAASSSSSSAPGNAARNAAAKKAAENAARNAAVKTDNRRIDAVNQVGVIRNEMETFLQFNKNIIDTTDETTKLMLKELIDTLQKNINNVISAPVTTPYTNVSKIEAAETLVNDALEEAVKGFAALKDTIEGIKTIKSKSAAAPSSSSNASKNPVTSTSNSTKNTATIVTEAETRVDAVLKRMNEILAEKTRDPRGYINIINKIISNKDKVSSAVAKASSNNTNEAKGAANNALQAADDADKGLVELITALKKYNNSSMSASLSSSSSASIAARPPDTTPKLKLNLAKISAAFDNLQKNKTYINRGIKLGSIKALRITKVVADIKKQIDGANDILANPASSNEELDMVKSLIVSAQGAINQILTDLNIPSADIATVQLEGGRRTRRKGKGSKKRTRRARRRHR